MEKFTVCVAVEGERGELIFIEPAPWDQMEHRGGDILMQMTQEELDQAVMEFRSHPFVLEAMYAEEQE